MIIGALFWISTYCTTGNKRSDLVCLQAWRYSLQKCDWYCISCCLLLLRCF